jgi:thiol:disulfide interchange protein DsbA
MKPALAALALAAALLTGCGKQEETPAPTATPAPPSAGATPVSTPAPAAEPAPATEAATASEVPAAADAPAPAPTQTPAPAAETTPATQASPAAPAEAAPAAAPAPVVAADIPPLRGPEPVQGQDYELIDPPSPMSPTPGKIEVAEVFAYFCIHCARMQKLVTPWKATLPADVDFKYVPTAHGQAEPFARAFYAAEAMGILPATHEGMFDSIAVKHLVKTGQPDEIAGLYQALGQDPAAVLSTMQSFAVNAQVARAQKANLRWAIDATPTFVVAGKYKVTSSTRGQEGVLEVVEHLIARERAAQATKPSP